MSVSHCVKVTVFTVFGRTVGWYPTGADPIMCREQNEARITATPYHGNVVKAVTAIEHNALLGQGLCQVLRGFSLACVQMQPR
jgi:hypothetical protein